MVTDNEVLEFFRGELSLAVTFTFKPIPIELDTPLQGLPKNPSNKCQNRLLCVCSQNQPEQVTGYMIDYKEF